jgi:mono/diheme cytochrome c family protein
MKRALPAGAFRTALITSALGAALAHPAAFAADPGRGRALYEARCGGCHGESVHNDASRKARSLDEVRARVAHFASQLKTGWTLPDVDDVAVHLNEIFYKFPCDPPLCPNAEPGGRTR